MLQCPTMQEHLQLEPVRGMRDHLPPDQAQLLAVRAALEGVLDAWGYQPIDLPVLERRDLYLKKVGEDLVGKLYDFSHQGRILALRPEWTASVLRAYLRGLQSEPLPVRLRYGGPVFRYERPQRATYRQFTQVGVELIGGAAPRGDAEIIVLACRGLAATGIREWKLTIGHVGVARTLLAQLGLPERTASQLLWSIERLRRGDQEALLAQLRASEVEGAADEQLHLGELATLPDDELAALLATTVRAMGLSLDSTSRPAEAIIERLIRKLRRSDPQPRIEQALASLERLSQAHGEPAHAFNLAGALLADLGLPSTELDELRVIAELVAAQGIEPPQLVVDLGLSRGLHYYSGMIFEIEGPDGLQLCGGGRYDDLVGALNPAGPRRTDVPAVGLAYGLERVVAQVPPGDRQPPSTILVAASDACFEQALGVAEMLRARGNQVLLDVRGRSQQANLRDAERRGCAALVAIEGAPPDAELVWHALSPRAAPRRLSFDAFAQEMAR